MTPFTEKRAYFTPRKSRSTDERLKIHLAPAEYAKIGRGKPWSAEVTDIDTGRRYSVQGAACGADCYCDAVVTYEHPMPDRAMVEVVAGKVRLIIMEEDMEYATWTVKDIVEWDSLTNVAGIAKMMQRHCNDRCYEAQYTIVMPEGLELSPRITRPSSKFERIINHKVAEREAA